ncbi:Serine decarboxylase 3 [Dichanthelium oligosanthes]|uniref:Serine decarboxylase 3 n=1 Tax=Dichanthelium oligosanthes TaxID=888268 RepID=A0A1E5UJN9_9POAL|nr:Serine decarboxylase 3 [Dichanthelium oligosanthes]
MGSNYGVHSGHFEVAVLDWFARNLELPKDQCWGYVTNGGTEVNSHGLLVGTELFPEGILYASQDSHYSIFKISKMYIVKCIKIDMTASGEMDYDDFRSKLLKNTMSPGIVNVNIGTTMEGAIDDVDKIIATFQYCGFDERFYIHCDGALAELIIPFVEQAIGSISVSFHKFIGCPMPCGAVMSRLKDVNRLQTTYMDYISSKNTTISGSRNGHAPIYLWYILNSIGYNGICREVEICLKNAQHLKYSLEKIRVSVFLNTLSTAVVFERPKDEAFVRKWQLSCEGNIAHVVVMPHVTIEKLNKFFEEFALLRGKEFSVPCVTTDIGPENCVCVLHEDKGCQE